MILHKTVTDTYFPPQEAHGKMLKVWYRGKMRLLTGQATLPDEWQFRIGIRMAIIVESCFDIEEAYVHWDMQDQLVPLKHLRGGYCG